MAVGEGLTQGGRATTVENTLQLYTGIGNLKRKGMENSVFHSLSRSARYRLNTKFTGTVSFPVILISWV